MTDNVFKQALDDMQPVRQITVEDVAKIMCANEGLDPEHLTYHTMGAANAGRKEPMWEKFRPQALALSKLGAIKVVGDV